MKIHCTFDELVDIRDLKPHPKNRNKHPGEQVSRLALILNYQGWRYPIKVSKRSGFVTSGHGRIEAAQANGWDKVPVNFQDYESEEQEYADVQSDNAIASWAELDLSGINFDIPNLGPDFNIDWLGIKNFALEPAEKLGQCDEDEVPEQAETRCKPGDIWQLGAHRLMCGDSTSVHAVERLMGGERADLVHTDPPYNVNYSNQDRPKAGKRDLGRIENDKMSDEEFLDFLKQAMTCAYVASKDDSSIYVWYASKETVNFHSAAAAAAGWNVSQQIIWKKPMLLGRGRYQWAHEPCVFGVKGSPFFTSDRTKTTVWDFGGYDKSKNEHPTQKPVFLPEEAIRNSSESGSSVLDLFGGSGSTLIACEKTNRKCFMMELDPHYCDVIIARWEKYTGKKASLVLGEDAGEEKVTGKVQRNAVQAGPIGKPKRAPEVITRRKEAGQPHKKRGRPAPKQSLR